MAKDLPIVEGMKVAALRLPGETLVEFSIRAKISSRLLTDLVKPGGHEVNYVTLEKLAAVLGTDKQGAIRQLGANGQQGGTRPEMDEVLKLADLLDPDQRAELARHLGGKPMKQAAKRRGSDRVDD